MRAGILPMEATQHILNSEGESVHAIMYTPPGKAIGSMLFCNPLFEERKSAARTLTETAESLCASGFNILRFDYRGCGDSHGDFSRYSVHDWTSDISAAKDFLEESAPGLPTGLLGLRFGAAIAFRTCSEDNSYSFVAGWEPVTDGRSYILHEMRKKLMKEMLTFGKKRKTREDLEQRLENGESIDLDGYELAPGLYKEITAMNIMALCPETAACLVLDATHTGRPSSATAELRKSWTQRNPNALFRSIRMEPFWNLTGYIDCSHAIELIREWAADTVNNGKASGIQKRER